MNDNLREPSGPPPGLETRLTRQNERVLRPIAKNWVEIEALCNLCDEGRLYEVELWIEQGKPIQCEPPEDRQLRKRMSPLEIAVEKGFHSLAQLLLVNGYNSNGDCREILSVAISAKNHSMVRLLLDMGADPSAVDFELVLETYDRTIMAWMVEAGADPCRQNALAKALRRKGRPLLGFVKTYLERFPEILRQINIALCNFAREGDEKGVALMLWLGADPHAVVPYPDGEETESEDCQEFALQAALLRWHEPIVHQLLKKPIPCDRVQEVFCSTAYYSHPDLVRKLLNMGVDPNAQLDGEHILSALTSHVTWLYSSMNPGRNKKALEAVALVAGAGARWAMDAKQLARFRRRLLDGSIELVKELLDVLRKNGVLSEQQIQDLTRTDAMKAMLSGRRRPRPDPWFLPKPSVTPAPESPIAVPRRTYWKRHWSQR